jgi:hypothetical protein
MSYASLRIEVGFCSLASDGIDHPTTAEFTNDLGGGENAAPDGDPFGRKKLCPTGVRSAKPFNETLVCNDRRVHSVFR